MNELICNRSDTRGVDRDQKNGGRKTGISDYRLI